jgi:histone deacetylase 8
VNDCVLAILALRRIRTSLTPTPQSSSPGVTTADANINTATAMRKARVMYLDLDLHLADGVARAFHVPHRVGSSHVLTLSLHHESPGFFPAPLSSSASTVNDRVLDAAVEDDPFTLVAPLLFGASCTTYARVWAGVEAVVRAYNPDVLVLQCGVDALAGDPCRIGNWALGGEGGLGWCVARAIGWGCRVLMLGGGMCNSCPFRLLSEFLIYVY